MAGSNNKQIAKNTIYLYIRMGLTTLVGLYTSRVILNTLGVEDFGTYGLVGGIVTMFSFFYVAASGATARFLTYEMGQGEKGRLADTFSTAFIIHALIAIAVAILVATIGLWFLWHKLNIPDGRMSAATIVLVCAVFEMAISVTQEPYTSVIIAHEHFDLYAYIEILNVTLKLIIVYILMIGDFDKLILYAFLHLGVTFIVAMTYRIYCLKHFPESHLHWIWEKKLMLPMLSYSGWDFFGTLTSAAKSQGTSFLINMFFGVTFNAASSIAGTVEGTLTGLSTNMLAAFRPQIIKQYSAGNNKESVTLIYQAAKFATILLVLLVIPFSIEMDFIMKLWLKNPPEYASIFCRIMMVSGCLNMASCAVFYGINASGKMGVVSILSSFSNLFYIIILYICYKFNCSVETAYYLAAAFVLVNVTCRAIPLQHYIRPFNYFKLLWNAYAPSLFIALITIASLYYIIQAMTDGIFRCIIIFAVDGIVGTLATLFIALNKSQRQRIIAFVKSKIGR